MNLINLDPCPLRGEAHEDKVLVWQYDEYRYDAWIPEKGVKPPRICICSMPVHIQAQLVPGWTDKGNDYKTHRKRE